MAPSMNMDVFQDAAQCSLVDTDQHFRGGDQGNDHNKLIWNSGQIYHTA
jgi:hypothetical protein